MTDNGDFIGIPFRDGGRDLGGCDCWGLVKLYLEMAGDIYGLPDYGGTPASELIEVAKDIAEAQSSPTWRKIERHEAKRFDVMTMVGRERVNGRPRNIECHVGVLIDPKRVLHVEEATASVIMRLDHPFIRHRLVGFYRHASLA